MLLRRLTDEAEAKAAMQTFTKAMQMGALTGDGWEAARDRAYPERSFGAFDGDELVGHARSLPFRTVVPGGALLPTAAVTAVGVRPTHRRRGILASLMERQLQDCVDREEPLASLRASEARIYGRFGYGVAGQAVDVDLTTSSGLRRRHEDLGTIRYVNGPELLDIVGDIRRRAVSRPGHVLVPEPITRRMLGPLLQAEHGDARWAIVHHDHRGKPDGYADWEALARDQWHTKGPTIEVGEVLGATTDVEAVLWQFLMDLDLVEVIRSGGRPVDDPLRWMLHDLRAYKVTNQWDEQWVRLVDVDRALAARTYGPTDTTAVIEVADRLLPQNDGRWELAAGGARRVKRAPDLELPIAELGAVYLGGTSVSELVAAGRIIERRRGGAARADALLRSPLAPFCGVFF